MDIKNNVLIDDFESILNSELEIEKFKDKSLLITGVTGLIGSLLVRFLLYANVRRNLNIKIYGVIRNPEKASKLYEKWPKDNLQFVIAHLGENDLRIDNNIDYIIHPAAVTQSKQLINNPVGTIRTSINGTEEVLKLAVKKNVKSMVYVSSMEIYGQPFVSKKTTESDLGYIDLTSPRSCYPESKRMCEMLCTSYNSQYGLNVKIARLAQTFGAGVLPNENRVFAQFAHSVINHENIILHTEGKSEGNYVYSADAIKALLFLLLNGEARQPYNVSNEDNHATIKEMAQMVIDNFGTSDEKVVIEIPKENTGYAPDVHMWLSNQKLRDIGWKPTINLVQSYGRLIEWMKN